VALHQRPHRFHRPAELPGHPPAGVKQSGSLSGEGAHPRQDSVPLRGFHPFEPRTPLHAGGIARHEPFDLAPAEQQPALSLHHGRGSHQSQRLPAAQGSRGNSKPFSQFAKRQHFFRQFAGNFRQTRTKQALEVGEVGGEVRAGKHQPGPVLRTESRDPPHHELVRINPFGIHILPQGRNFRRLLGLPGRRCEPRELVRKVAHHIQAKSRHGSRPSRAMPPRESRVLLGTLGLAFWPTPAPGTAPGGAPHSVSGGYSG